MAKSLPDKWVRKAVYNAIDNIVVDDSVIKCYDTRVTSANGYTPDRYVLMTTQTNVVGERTKCEYVYESSILLDIVLTYDRPGNTGSRLEVDNIAEAVRSQLENLTLDVSNSHSGSCQGQEILFFNRLTNSRVAVSGNDPNYNEKVCFQTGVEFAGVDIQVDTTHSGYKELGYRYPDFSA